MKMKKILSSIIATALTLSSFGMTSYAAETVSEWDGEAVTTEWYDENPDAKEFVLSSASDLAGLASILWNWSDTTNPFQGTTVKLAVDVDLGNYEWLPIGLRSNANGSEKGKWHGSFDGQGHTISNLKISEEYQDSGLFGYTGGGAQTIENLTLENVTIRNDYASKPSTGALVGRINSNTFVVSNVDVTGKINIQGSQFVGGIAGYGRGTVEDCDIEGYGSISASYNDAGGLIGIYYGAENTSAIENCTIIGDAENGGLKISADGCAGGAVGLVSTSYDMTLDSITVSNVKVDAGSEAYGGASYVAYGYAATNSKASDVTITSDDGEVAAEDAEDITLPVAKIGDVNYFTFADAAAAAKDGDVIELADGTYDMISIGKDVTIKGSRNAIIDNIGAYRTDASLTFDGVTLDFMPNVNYTGFQHSDEMTYNNVKIVGQQFLYGNVETFNNCLFVQDSNDAYNVWTYGAKQVYFNNCTFESAGKSVLVYNEGACATKLDVADTDFIASAPVEGKAAIEIDTTLMPVDQSSSINIDAATTATGFAAGSDSGSTLWNDKKSLNDDGSFNTGNGNVVVVVDDEVVHTNVTGSDEDTTYAAVVDSMPYTTMADAIAAIKNDSNVNILAGTYDGDFNISGKTGVTVKATGDVTINGKPSFGKDFDVSGIKFSYPNNEGKYIINGYGTITDCEFTGYNGLRYCYAKGGDVVLKDCVITGSVYGVHFDGSEGQVIIDNCTITGWTSFARTIEKVTISDSKFEEGNYNQLRFYQDAEVTNTEFNPEMTMDTGKDGLDLVVEDCTVSDGSDILDIIAADTISTSTVKVDDVAVGKEAKIVTGDEEVYCNTLAEAVNGAANGSTIDLMGNTVAFPEVNTISKNITITNGTISINPAIATFAAATVAPGWIITGNVTFENVEIIGENYNTGSWGLFYLAADNASIDFVNSAINLKNDAANGGFVKGENSTDYVTFNNTDGYFENTGRGFTNIKKVTLENDSDLVFKGTTADGLENAFNMTGIEIKDTSSIEIDGCTEYGIKISEDVNVEGSKALLVVRNSGIADIVERDDVTGNPALRATGGGRVFADIIDSNVWVVESAGGKVVATANNIWVQYEKDSETEESVTYNIVLSGYKNNINRLTTADLTFDFDVVNTDEVYANSNMGYEIVPADGITLTRKGDDRYMFSFDGITSPDESGENIVIGKVTVSGFGEFTFKVDTSDEANITNLVNATEVEDNIVDSFVPGGAENKGTLVLNTVMDAADDMVEAITGEITIPKRTLTINVQFPNKVEYNAATYQDMSITIKGGQLEKEIALGNINKVDGGYQIAESLDYNTTYTITVAGAGYRTARYSVVMTDDKTLNFWNNVKSEHNMLEIEEGVSGLTTKNFLAGDIVKDNTINIWDLNAVVSFFGQDASENPEKYVRYDLNRDKKIDSKDVAYVLVSWGN